MERSGHPLDYNFAVSVANLGGVSSLGTYLESGFSQSMSWETRFGPKEEIWTPKIRTEPFHAVSRLSWGMAKGRNRLYQEDGRFVSC